MPFDSARFPIRRPRRLRSHPRLRDLVREQRLTVDDLIYPLFVYHGRDLRREIASMPGQYQLSLDRLGEVVAEVVELEIPGVLLFGIPEHKDATGSARLGRRRDRPGGRPPDQAAGPRAAGHHRRLLLRVHRPRPLRPADRPAPTAGSTSTTTPPPPARRAGRQPRPGRGRRGRPLGDDGRDGRRDPRGARRGRVLRACRSSPTPPSSPAPTTARSATPPRAPRPSATAGPTRWTPPTATRRSARSPSTWPRGPTW